METEEIFLGSKTNDLTSRLEIKDFYSRGGSLWLREDDLFMRNNTEACKNKLFLRDNGFLLAE